MYVHTYTGVRPMYVQYIASLRMYVQTVERRQQVLHTLGVETHLFYLFTFFLTDSLRWFSKLVKTWR
jgi:hypothetical protein